MGFAFIDIIFFGIIAVVLFFRLRDTLGTRTGHEKKRPTVLDNIEKENIPEAIATIRNRIEAAQEIEETKDMQTALTKISLKDPQFTKESFLHGAKLAFEFIVEKFAEGDKSALEPLVSAELMDAFEGIIDARAEKGHMATTEILNVKKAEIKNAFIKKNTAYVTALFIADETRYTKDENGELISGDPNLVTETKDIWTFSRPLSSRDPNWTLVETKIEDV